MKVYPIRVRGQGLVTATFGPRTTSPYEAEIKRAVERVVADRLMMLAAGADMPQVRAIATYGLSRIADNASAQPSPADVADSAHRLLLVQDIRRFMVRPAAASAPITAPDAPPGAPIGEPAMDWLGTLGSRRWLSSPAARAWLRQLDEPLCSQDVRFERH